MLLANGGKDAVLRSDQTAQLGHIPLITRPHLPDKHLVFRREFFSYGSGHSHGGVEAARSIEGLIFFPQDGAQSVLGRGLSKAAGDADAD